MGRVAALPDPAALDAVTLDAYGTLIELDEPVARLQSTLAELGVERSAEHVADAFALEVAFYAKHKCHAATAPALAELQRACAGTFTDALGLELDFTDGLLSSLVFRPLPGAVSALAALRSRGLSLAVVSNWDCSLSVRLAEAGIRIDVVVTCAEAGRRKPHPRPFQLALERLGTAPERALHVGDQPEDREGAHAAGLYFAPAPLAEVVARWL